MYNSVKRSNYDRGTEAVIKYVRDKGIKLSKIAQETGISYGKITRSLNNDYTRTLTVDEYFKICDFLEVDPLTLYETA